MIDPARSTSPPEERRVAVASELLDALSTPGTVFLDTSRPDPERRDGLSTGDGLSASRLPKDVRTSLLFTNPDTILRADRPEDVASVLGAADQALASGKHVAGALSYEAGRVLMEMPVTSSPGPLIWLGVYDAPISLQPHEVDAAFSSRSAPPDLRNARFDIPEDAYHEAIARIRSHIREGDVYQINYTGSIRFDIANEDALLLYTQMRRRQPVPYGAFLNLGDTQLLCASPELFIRQEGRRIVTKPMKGTIRRGMTSEEDRRLREELASDPKSRAENLMIVDLLRNDLSICCRPGSVRVPDLFATDTYDTLTQMTSTVEGELQPDTSFSDIMQALFPCGSITGAPKHRAVQRIHELEPNPRGFYCGAIGYAAPDERACFNVAIRTVELRPEAGEERLSGTMGTGSGIVWDSDAAEEYEECKLKARFLTDPPSDDAPFRLIETMRVENACIPLWAHHWERLAASASYFGFTIRRDHLEIALEPHIAKSSGRPVVVRLTVGPEGDVDITTRPVPETNAWTLAISTETPNPHDPFFYHKTTRRDGYDRALAEVQAAGYDEALLVASNGHVTEGARSNIIAVFGDMKVTPPIEDGLLGGVYRNYLLSTDDSLCEESLTASDLYEADRIFCCNAVRHLVPANLAADLRRQGS